MAAKIPFDILPYTEFAPTPLGAVSFCMKKGDTILRGEIGSDKICYYHCLNGGAPIFSDFIEWSNLAVEGVCGLIKELF